MVLAFPCSSTRWRGAYRTLAVARCLNGAVADGAEADRPLDFGELDSTVFAPEARLDLGAPISMGWPKSVP